MATLEAIACVDHIGSTYQMLSTKFATERKDGYIPRRRCIRDKDGRIVVAICFNMHLDDAWEWANAGDYPEKFSSAAFRIVLNYITYAMTH